MILISKRELIVLISHPEIQSEKRSLVIHLMAKHDQTSIHLAANDQNIRLFVVKYSTSCDYSCTSLWNYRTINVFHYRRYSRVCWGCNSELWNTLRSCRLIKSNNENIQCSNLEFFFYSKIKYTLQTEVNCTK